MTTATTQPSFAATLHKLALGEEIPGDELLALPGVAELDCSFPVLSSLTYLVDDVPELFAQAGALAAGVSVKSSFFADDMVKLILSGLPIPNPLPPIARHACFQLGADADISHQLFSMEPQSCPT